MGAGVGSTSYGAAGTSYQVCVSINIYNQIEIIINNNDEITFDNNVGEWRRCGRSECDEWIERRPCVERYSSSARRNGHVGESSDAADVAQRERRAPSY